MTDQQQEILKTIETCITDLKVQLQASYNVALELTEERNILADENEKMAEYLLYLNECNKLDLVSDDFGWLIKEEVL
jgi:hypothetical protein